MSPEHTRPRRLWVALLPIVVAVVVFVCDQAVKAWVVSHLPLYESVPVLGNALQWRYVKNPGAAFSFGMNSTWVFTLLSAAVVVFLVSQLKKIRSVVWAVFLGMLLGGTLGNLTDRILREPGFPNGHVIDFIYTPWMMPAIYNVADVAIVSSMVLFVLLTLFGVRIDGAKKSAEPDDA